MNKYDIETAVGLAGKSVAFIVSLCAVIAALLPRTRKAFSAYCAASDLATKFGRDAGTVLHKLLVTEGGRLAETRAMVEALSSAIHLGVYVCDEHGKCISVNIVLERWFGLSKEKCVEYGWLEAIVNREQAFQRWRFAITSGTPYRDEYEIKNIETGIAFKAATEAVRIHTEGGNIYIGFVRKL